jgi:ABC-type multidrug transport system fused ATPase/permease subunit
MQQLMDTAINKNFLRFTHFLYIAGGLIVFGMIITYLGRYSTRRYNLSFIKDLKNSITEHVQKMPIFILKKYTSGDIVSRVNNDLTIISSFYNSIPSLIFQPILLILAIIYMLSVNVKLTLATIFLIPISSIIFDKINKPIQAYAKRLMEQSGVMNTLLQDTINGIYILKSFNLINQFNFKFKKVTSDIKTNSLKISKLNAFLTPVFLALRLIPQLVYPLYGGYLAMNGELTMGNLFAFGVLISYVFNPVENILGFISQVRETKPAIRRIFELLLTPIEKLEEGVVHVKDTQPSIEFENVTFLYEDVDKDKILDNVSFIIEKGSKVALVGPSGGGKSTILKLICGFYEPNSGVIRLNGNCLNAHNVNTLRSQISYMSQESYLYPTTIAENISIGKPSATRVEILNAAKAANAHEFITKLPKGYDTLVGQSGNILSGGEVQRVALARIILKNAPLIIMDEPTAALDTNSEALIQEAINELTKSKTVLIVAHRLATIKAVDQIIVIENARIEQVGIHSELINIPGTYSKLYMNQFGTEARKEGVFA